MIDQTMFCEWNEYESEACPRKDEIPRGSKTSKILGGGRKTPRGGAAYRGERTGLWCS